MRWIQPSLHRTHASPPADDGGPAQEPRWWWRQRRDRRPQRPLPVPGRGAHARQRVCQPVAHRLGRHRVAEGEQHSEGAAQGARGAR
eukprot:1820804-Heterocapsa_arctica.AAC.1